MPTIVTEGGLTIRLFTKDHFPPPHVHVESNAWEIRVIIGEKAEAWTVKWGKPRKGEVAEAEALVQKHLEACNAKWREIYGSL